MKRFALYIIILYIGVLLTGCRDTLVPPEEVPQPRAEAERTVIIYMAADNTLTTAVKLDTMEMVRGKNFVPENVRLIKVIAVIFAVVTLIEIGVIPALMTGFVIWAIALLFDYGCELQNESDEIL